MFGKDVCAGQLDMGFVFVNSTGNCSARFDLIYETLMSQLGLFLWDVLPT